MVSHFSIFYSTLFEIVIENFDSNREANYRKDPSEHCRAVEERLLLTFHSNTRKVESEAE